MAKGGGGAAQVNQAAEYASRFGANAQDSAGASIPNGESGLGQKVSISDNMMSGIGGQGGISLGTPAMATILEVSAEQSALGQNFLEEAAGGLSPLGRATTGAQGMTINYFNAGLNNVSLEEQFNLRVPGLVGGRQSGGQGMAAPAA